VKATVLNLHLIGCGPPSSARGTVEQLGFKAFNLTRIARLGVPIPPAFVLGTDWFHEYKSLGSRLPPDTREALMVGMGHLEAQSGLAFGNPRRPLLLSVRSGASVSMPGMLDTVLDVGLCNTTISGFLRVSGNPHLVWDSYRRLIEGWADTVAGLDGAPFAAARQEALASAGVARVAELDFRALRALAQREQELYEAATDQQFPQSPIEQLETAIAAVFRSWNGAKAAFYRQAHGIGPALGTAVTVQRMVFGNAGGTSGAGVGFTRNPATGSAELYLDYAPNAQGEDVVSGRVELAGGTAAESLPAGIRQELAQLAALLEHEFHDAQEFEFTVENGILFVLQTRDAKRTALAALKIAVDFAESGLSTAAQARERVAKLEPAALESVELAGAACEEALATGISAGIGVASGVAVCDPARAIERARAGETVILVRDDIATGDIAALEVSAGLLAVRGARTAHAAVVARQLGKACIVGCAGLEIDAGQRAMRFGSRRLVEGDMLTLDAATGRVYAGTLPIVRRPPVDLLDRLAKLKD
jgi:pyruvate,orthophosphate dikinase